MIPRVSIVLLCSVIAAHAVEFNRDIRPLLNEQCFKCHGGVKEAGELNLQFRDQALKAGESGLTAIIPGKPDESEFIARLITHDKTDRMPKKAPPLAPEQIAMLKQWIAEGAQWQEHWAYEVPEKSGLGIDATVQRRLAREGLSLSAEADRATLARRVAFDLTGLPPSPEEIASFVKDPAPDAYERWVDRLLASPAYGERWAATWLDLARYADSKGYESDRFRDMWRYRDWVVDAYNRDQPYNQFLIDQLAGDLLPEATEEQIIATAFHRNTPQNDEGGTDDEEFRTYAVIDRLNTTFDALQGTSIGCVQCHGHPYDPFVHREFYQLLAFFNNTADADREDQAPTRKFRARADVEKVAGLEKSIAETQQELDTRLKQPENQQAFAKWVRDVSVKPERHAFTDVNVTSTAGKYTVAENGRVLLQGGAPDRTTITVSGKLVPGKFSALLLELLPDSTLPHQGPGADGGVGNFILTGVRATMVTAEGKETPLSIASATATLEQHGWPVVEALKQGEGLKDEGEGGWAIAGGTGRPQIASFVLASPFDVSPGAILQVKLECENERWNRHVLGSFQLAATAGVPRELPKEVREVLAQDPAKWKPLERTRVERHFFAGRDPELAALFKKLEEHRVELAAVPTCDMPIMQELGGDKARTTHIFERGAWTDKREAVLPATPKILNPWHEEYPRNRLGFALWLTNGENPLTARVQVNRVWEQLFGVGLVETLEDFGSQGDKPIYQDLLDDLAVRFQSEMGWSQKKLLREIVLSQVYRQSSKTAKELLERDPANRLLARGPRFRLTSEQLRDQALAVSGILGRKMFGPPVMPFQPPGTWLVPYEGRDWVLSPGEDSRRRALYTFIRRSAAYPSALTFDAPNREYCLVRRTRTNTPLQSLDLLNNPVFMEAAAGLAKRMTEAGEGIESQIAQGLLLATQRAPRPDEIAILKKLHERVGGNMTLVANAILNLDEVLTKN